MQLEHRGSADWITWERPNARNAWTRNDVQTLGALLRQAASGPSRSIVCHGVGGDFSAGDDLKESVELTAEEWTVANEAWAELTLAAIEAPKPVIAAVEGTCVGGAFEFVCACDVTLVAPDALLGFPDVRVGLAPIGGATALLPRSARPLLLTGEIIGPQEAQALGLIWRICDDPVSAAAGIAKTMQRCSPTAVRQTKLLLVEQVIGRINAASAAEARVSDDLFAADGREGLIAFLERRSPTFASP